MRQSASRANDRHVQVEFRMNPDLTEGQVGSPTIEYVTRGDDRIGRIDDLQSLAGSQGHVC